MFVDIHDRAAILTHMPLCVSNCSNKETCSRKRRLKLGEWRALDQSESMHLGAKSGDLDYDIF